MKREYYYLVAFLVLVIALIWFLTRDHGRTLDRRLTDFAVQETDRLDRIVLEEGEKRLELEKKADGKWIVNGMFETRKDAVEQFFETLRRIRVKSPSPRSLREELLRGIGESSLKVTLHKGRRSKSYYVYEHAPRNETFMMMENSEEPFAVDIYGFSGRITELFVIDEGYWRPNVLFRAIPSQIISVRVDHAPEAGRSFLLRVEGKKEFELTRLFTGEKVEPLNDSLVVAYLSNFYYVPFQRYANEKEKMKADSLRSAEPAYRVSVKGENEYEKDVKLFHVTLSAEKPQEMRETNPFILHGLINNDKDMIIVRYTDMDLILRTADYFSPGS